MYILSSMTLHRGTPTSARGTRTTLVGEGEAKCRGMTAKERQGEVPGDGRRAPHARHHTIRRQFIDATSRRAGHTPAPSQRSRLFLPRGDLHLQNDRHLFFSSPPPLLRFNTRIFAFRITSFPYLISNRKFYS